MLAIIALGNPGPEYAFTRHNYGWLVADRIEDSVTIAGRRTAPSYVLVTARSRGRDLLICRPQTYMNRSGIAVDNLVREYGLEPEDLIVLYDDIDIEFGRIRLRIGGGDGGHKGIRSIINELGWRDFLRLRLGIKPEEKPEDAAEYVLAPFSEAETEALQELVPRAANAALQLLTTEPKLAMNQINRR